METTIIDKPSNIDPTLLEKMKKLVEEGEQVKREYLDYGIERADLIALIVDDNDVVAAATLKNPRNSYRDDVFEMAGEEQLKKGYDKELGYIVTNPKFEGKKKCQKLLTDFIPKIAHKQMFATTRKPAMAHILRKYGFEQVGNTYKKDLALLITK
ncbi:MAG TPA: hypothetical protein VGE25_06720 [Sediminibacterium sp.]